MTDDKTRPRVDGDDDCLPFGEQGRIAIIGCGTIGRSWAICFGRAGYEVALHDAVAGEAARAQEAIGACLHDLEQNGAPLSGAAVLDRISVAGSLEEALAGAIYVQESIAEDEAVKTAIFREMDALAPPEVTLASSTSAIMPSQFLETIAGRHRCLVAHPFNPPHLIPLVEIVPSPWTAPSVVASCSGLLRSVGQSPIVISREITGFVGNRLQAAVVNEAMNLIRLGVVTPDDLDKCMTSGLGRRWAFLGPFATMDLNAPKGFADYAAKFGESYQHLGTTLGVAQPWSQEAAARIEAWRRQEVPVDKVATAQASRDQTLLRLGAWLRAQGWT